MKNQLKYIAVLAIAALSTTACDDFLEKEVDLSISNEQVFSKFENTRGFLANIYTYLPDAFEGLAANDGGQYQACFGDCMTDNAVSYWNVHYQHGVQTGNYNAETHYYANTYWPRYMKGIRAANQFMTYAKESVIGNVQKSGDDNHLYNRYIAEARFLRAMFHFELVKWFGPSLIIGDDANGKPIVFGPSEQDLMNQPRKSPAEVLDWIASECDAVKDVLPFRYSNEDENWGRVNGAAAYALKSRALLYKASPLNNTGNVKSWWNDAATAAEAFISKNASSANPYGIFTVGDPSKNYYQCFVSTPHLNNEYILSRSEWDARNIEWYCAPCGFSGTDNSVGRTNPTQNLVDAYETINGLAIDKDPSYDSQNPWANRDPRLEQSIIHHGTIWGDKNQDEERAIDITYGSGADYQELHGGTMTGYYLKKFLNNMSWKSPSNLKRACPIFRYAEILLNAAEANFEAGNAAKACDYINQVRDRVAMPGYTAATLTRERIQNERRVELCFEDHRYPDERRWKLFDGVNKSSEATSGLPYYQQVVNLYGVRVAENGSLSYDFAESYTRNFFAPKDYYFPIPNSEVKKAPKLIQNSGWEM